MPAIGSIKQFRERVLLGDLSATLIAPKPNLAVSESFNTARQTRRAICSESGILVTRASRAHEQQLRELVETTGLTSYVFAEARQPPQGRSNKISSVLR